MCENIENLKSGLKIRILANTTQTTLKVNYFRKWYQEIKKSILRNLEKFKNSIKIHFFIRELAANFNNLQGSSTSAQKLLLTHLPVAQSFKTA